MAHKDEDLTEWNARNAWIEYKLGAKPTADARAAAAAEFDMWLLAREVATRKQMFDMTQR